MASGGRRLPIWAEILQQAVAIGGLIYSLKLCMSYLDPYKEQRVQVSSSSSSRGGSLQLAACTGPPCHPMHAPHRQSNEQRS
jgi:hypothetical protein